MKNKKLNKLILAAILSAQSYVVSTFIVFPNMAPFQHFFNVITAVFLGPYYAFAAALLTGCMRMLLNGRPVLAIIGAVFGAFFAGVLYKKTKSYFAAALGEIFGTGILSAIISYPVMKYLFHVDLQSAFFYIPFFLPASAVGAGLALVVLLGLKKSNAHKHLQKYIAG